MTKFFIISTIFVGFCMAANATESTSVQNMDQLQSNVKKTESLEAIINTNIIQMACLPEGAKCLQNSDCCHHRCTGTRCDNVSGND